MSMHKVGGVAMHTVAKIIHKYLCEDAISLIALQSMDDDPVWRENHGYYIRKTGRVTDTGKKHHREMDEKLVYHLNRITDESLDDANMDKLQKELRAYIKNNSCVKLRKELTEKEYYTFLAIAYDRW